MRKLLLFASLLLLSHSYAQDDVVNSSPYKVSLKGGLSVNSMAFGDESENKTTFYAGAGFEYKPSNFGIEAELQYTNSGSEFTTVELEEEFETEINRPTLNLIVAGKYYPTETVALKAGPYAGYAFDSTIKTKGIESDFKDDVKDVDFGLTFGIDFNLTDNLLINAKYLLGLQDINKNDDTDSIKNRYFQLGLSYSFNL